MYMNDWVKWLDAFLQSNEQDILQDIGKVSHEVTVALAEEEFGKSTVTQDRLLESDFDKVVKKLIYSLNSDLHL